MITQQQVKALDMETFEDYFDYIIESKINGQRKQARELFNELSNEQKRQFFDYVDTVYYYDEHDNGVKGITAELVNYLTL